MTQRLSRRLWQRIAFWNALIQALNSSRIALIFAKKLHKERIVMGLGPSMFARISGWLRPSEGNWQRQPSQGFIELRHLSKGFTEGVIERQVLNDLTTTASFAQVTEPKPLIFPQALGPHDAYQTEWWYYTGNLETESGREFGYQLTFFRRGLTPETEPVTDSSAWRSNQIYFADFTITDIEQQKFYPHERFSRQSAALSGAQADPYRVWLEDWSASAIAPGIVHLVAEADDVALDLTLTETLPPVLQGDRGYSKKGPEPGNASYYYSILQQQTQGTLTVADETFAVQGLTWKDHEYSTSALSPGTVGWDWFSLQLNNGSALMLYCLRQENGDITDISSGTYISTDGSTQPIASTDWQIDVIDTWRSPTSKAVYPSRWHIEIPKLALVLDGKSLVANQELNLSTTYWEGAVDFEGTVAEQPVNAKGYIEMTGYADRLDAVL